ncbi:hypothetical protein B0F90DRAFT_1667056 [Multifurca ochricompacta]|uniref:Uncharacterized protein n=1 Tax=Multifurca ochricompacta TaxID=376703 RepID=A0AAD4M7R6_9AGAM|nr:hypothetical protein B0F90DRAFT_1667056 [Multifurca ochricompacta]
MLASALFPQTNGNTTTASATGIFSSNIFNRKASQSNETPSLIPGGALSWAAPKPSPSVWDMPLKLVFFILSKFLAIVQRFTPSFVWGFVTLSIPPLIAIYELTVRRLFPRLPSVFKIAFWLYQHGVLTMGTVTWLISSLPQSMMSGLSIFGGVAMSGTAGIAGGIASAGASAVAGNATALIGGAASIAGDAAKTVTDISQVVSEGRHKITEQATSIATAGANGAAVLTEGATKAVTNGVSLLQNGQTALTKNITNITHLVSGEQGIAASVPVVPDVAKNAVQAAGAAIQTVTNPAAAIGATQTAMTQGVTKFANVLGSVNPLGISTTPKGTQNSQLESSQQSAMGNLLHPKIPGWT